MIATETGLRGILRDKSNDASLECMTCEPPKTFFRSTIIHGLWQHLEAAQSLSIARDHAESHPYTRVQSSKIVCCTIRLR